MTLYYSLVFLILVLEIACFLLLLIPLPNTWRKKIFLFFSTNPEVQHIRYILRIVFGFIFVLLVDSVNRLQAIQSTVSSTEGLEGTMTPVHDARADANFAAKKFYAQRNMYLTGSTLLLTLILRHTYNLTLDVIRLQDENERLTSSTTTSADDGSQAPSSTKGSQTSSKKHVE